jgi:hypothetical protein
MSLNISRNLLLVLAYGVASLAGIEVPLSPTVRLLGVSEDPLMSDDRLHIVFGTGQVGTTLAAHLAGMGIAVRTVSRHRPPALAGVDWRAADAADPEATADAAKGPSVIYQCLNAPYNQWRERFPPLQRAVLAAAERTGALLVSLENLYGYGPTGGRMMTEDLPLAATGVKGRPGPP